MDRSPFILFLLLSLLPLKSFCWGSEGHKITAEVAWDEMPQAIRDSVQYYLDGESIEDAAVWMDEMRKVKGYGYLKPMHYINIEKGDNYEPSDRPNIINELNTVINELCGRKHLSKEQTTTDLKILLHLMGDLHQPLHVGYGSDEGGNHVHLIYLRGKDELHDVWDNRIIKTKHIRADDCLQLLKGYSQQDIAQVEGGDVLSWMRESRSHLGEVYDYHDNAIEHDYINKNAIVVETQLLYGGLRAAKLLEKIFTGWAPDANASATTAYTNTSNTVGNILTGPKIRNYILYAFLIVLIGYLLYRFLSRKK